MTERAAQLGDWLFSELRRLEHPEIREIRGRGLMVGIELTGPARPYCERSRHAACSARKRTIS